MIIQNGFCQDVIIFNINYVRVCPIIVLYNFVNNLIIECRLWALSWPGWYCIVTGEAALNRCDWSGHTARESPLCSDH